MPHEVGNQVKLLPTYNVDNYGVDSFIPLFNDVSLTAQSITISSSALTQSYDDGNVPIDHQDTLLSDSDTIHLLHEGNDTAFDQTYRWRPDMSAIVYKTRLLLAIGLNVSAYTSGTIDLTNCTITITEVGGNNNQIFKQTFPITMTALTGTGSAYFILDADYSSIFKVYSGNPLDVRIEIPVATKSGTATAQTGVLPLFCYSTPAQLKPFTLSGITFHIHASLDHADPVFNQDISRVV
jgi:hypothetical protein